MTNSRLGQDKEASCIGARSLPRERGDPVSRLLYAFMLTIYLLTARGHIQEVDSWASVKTAEAILRHGTLAIEPAMDGVTLSHGSQNFSKYGIGAAIAMLPFVGANLAVVSLAGWDSEFWLGVFESFHAAFFAAAGCVFLYKISIVLGARNRASLAASVIFGLATLCWAYAVRDYSEAVQLSLMLGAVYFLLRSTKNDPALAGACFAALVLVKAASLVYLPLFVAYIFFQSEYRLRSTLHFAAPVVLAMLFLASLNYARFENIFEFGYGAEGRMFSAENVPSNMLRLLFSTSFGLFIYSPAVILGIVAFPFLLRKNPRVAIFITSLISTNLVLNAAWHDIGGGHSWGPRLLLPTLGFWIVPLAVKLEHITAPLGRVFVGGIIVLSFAVTLTGVFETIRPIAPPNRSVTDGAWPTILMNKAINKVETMRVDKYPLNLWYVRVADHSGFPHIAWFAPLGLGAIGLVCAVRLVKAVAGDK